MKEDTPEEKRGPKWCCRGEGKGGHWCSGCEKFWTPEEWKSFELIEKYLALKPNRDLYPSLHEEFMEEAKQCALIAQDRVIEKLEEIKGKSMGALTTYFQLEIDKEQAVKESIKKY